MNRMDWEALVFKSLAHPARLAILDSLRLGEQCVCHLEHALGMRQSYISQQLAVLKEAGIIQDRRDGWNIFYLVTHPEIFSAVDSVRSLPGIRVRIPVRRPARPAHCPCPKCRPDEERSIPRENPQVQKEG